MIEEIMTNLYKVEVPLPDPLLRFINSYIIKGSERNLIIDPGMNREECLNVMRASLRKLSIDLRMTDFFITHSHPDHFSLVSDLATEESILYINKKEMDIVDRFRFGTLWDEVIHFTCRNGFPENEPQEIPHPNGFLRFKDHLPFKSLEDGESLNIGEYFFECIKTPGHSQGHMCLYEPEEKILFAGDHLLKDITPGIQLRSDEGNPVRDFLSSLDKIDKLDITLVLPGHGNIFRHCKERIEELKSHHQKRAREILSILEKGRQTAYQVASQMTWDVHEDSWDFFPVLQKWFATGEAIAHMKYLEEKGTIRKETLEQKIVYSLNT